MSSLPLGHQSRLCLQRSVNISGLENITSGFVAEGAEAGGLQHVNEGTSDQGRPGDASGEAPSADPEGSFTSVCVLFSSVSTFHADGLSIS